MATPPSLDQLKQLGVEQLEHLAQDIRQRILSTCLKNGGHLGASLGAVEIAVALHAVFDSPQEPLIWDVGHQAYAHKLLTGRWEAFSGLRKKGGPSGFLSREESPHDVFGAGHSSTALSAALAMAWERRESQDAIGEKPTWTVAVVGDGGLTAGIAFEALNNIRASQLGPFLIVLNDNQMSISQNVGAMPVILSGDRAEAYFDGFGADYLGPVDGHNLRELLGVLRGLKASGATRPVVLHAITEKGRGYAPAEDQPEVFHGVSPVKEKVPGQAPAARSETYSERFGVALEKLAEADERVVAICAAMPEGTGLSGFARRFGRRFFDVGIAEPHAVTLAAGLATQGRRPVVAIYSTFLQRSLDQIIHDVALQGLGVVFAIDRAGLVGADGPTHHGAFDLAYLGLVPGLKVYAPASLCGLERILTEQVTAGTGPVAIRYPRGAGPLSIQGAARTVAGGDVFFMNESLDPGTGPGRVIVALGSAFARAQAAWARIPEPERSRTTLVGVERAKPVPDELLEFLAAVPSGARIWTVEDGAIQGGFGQTIAAKLGRPVETLGYPDRFVGHGTPEELESDLGLSAVALAERWR